jgi:hypothetical protein
LYHIGQYFEKVYDHGQHTSAALTSKLGFTKGLVFRLGGCNKAYTRSGHKMLGLLHEGSTLFPPVFLFHRMIGERLPRTFYVHAPTPFARTTHQSSRGHRGHFLRLSRSARPTARERREPPHARLRCFATPLLSPPPGFRPLVTVDSRRRGPPPSQQYPRHGAAVAGVDRDLRQHHRRRRGRRRPRARGNRAGSPPSPTGIIFVASHAVCPIVLSGLGVRVRRVPAPWGAGVDWWVS